MREHRSRVYAAKAPCRLIQTITLLALDKPGKKVDQKPGLNKAIVGQGWSMFLQMLAYKQDWHGGMVLKVAPHHTSQQCPACHHTSAQNRLTQADVACTQCGYTANADEVGAINIRTREPLALASRALPVK